MTKLEVRWGDWLISYWVEDCFARDPRQVHNIKLSMVEWARWNVR